MLTARQENRRIRRVETGREVAVGPYAGRIVETLNAPALYDLVESANDHLPLLIVNARRCLLEKGYDPESRTQERTKEERKIARARARRIRQSVNYVARTEKYIEAEERRHRAAAGCTMPLPRNKSEERERVARIAFAGKQVTG